MPLCSLVAAAVLMTAADAEGWMEHKGMGYTCGGAEFRGTVPDHNKTAEGCSAAAQAMTGCHSGVNYATYNPSTPTACYVCRVPDAVKKLQKDPTMISFTGPMPPLPPACPPPPVRFQPLILGAFEGATFGGLIFREIGCAAAACADSSLPLQRLAVRRGRREYTSNLPVCVLC